MSDSRIPCPLGKLVQKKSRRLGSSAQELADLEEMEEDYVVPFLDRLSQAIIHPEQLDTNNTNHPPSPQDQFDHNFNDVGDDVRMMTDESSSDSESDVDSEPEIPGLAYVHLTGCSTYQERRIREAQKWKEITGVMFLTFMKCRLIRRG
ncbi:uncharacterized protein MELLADRAFT_103818 [Melampsora larici-populina 98AG31]|uniref:Uncharacterized protein n=1 Tax=Melampsora larici-populina (strain 98AG31 / pathotype 3-4-7) TaxID=747676 RepID=F4RCK0_MELLP|nr:uncharacterized protein MELLADRAFT_103818 [Melampsora larici-populina 98AG31]EGG09749.1 hypothetical protein MELLADRAFT_103818 [Melampsora larici-populina 98AG31]